MRCGGSPAWWGAVQAFEYLERRSVWPGYPVPSVRWLAAAAAVRVRLYPRLPLGAAGALVYRFTVPGKLGAVRAVQVEAVDAHGARLDRLAVLGSGPRAPLNPKTATLGGLTPESWGLGPREVNIRLIIATNRERPR